VPTAPAACADPDRVGEQEVIIALDGRLLVRTPDGERILERGDVVCGSAR
jgi:hypothetical protein